MPKSLQISSVEVSGSNSNIDAAERLGLGCNFEGARYHIWLNPKTLDVGEFLYKNPAAGVDHRDEGHFNTRHLKTTSAFSQALITTMLKAYHSRNLLARYHAAERREAAAEKAKSLKLRREHRLRSFGPRLFAVVVEARDQLAKSCGHAELAIKLEDLIRKIDPALAVRS